MNALDLLRLKIRRSFTGTLRNAAWGETRCMSRVLEEVCSAFDTAADTISERSIGKTLSSFRATGTLHTFLDLKYACIGVSQQADSDGWRLLEDDDLFPVLLRAVSGLSGNPRRLRKCFQGLLAGYFDYPAFDEAIPEHGRRNWSVLRDFLRDHLDAVQRAKPALEWVGVIVDHANLLGEDPCGRYGAALAHGDLAGVKEVFRCLLVPRNSWIWEVIVLARIRGICAFSDDEFKERLASCLALVTQGSGIRLSDLLKKKCLARLIIRYAQCASRPPCTALCDALVSVMGNPWIDRAAWDAQVGDEGAHRMVEGWLKGRLISGYFRLLTRGGSPALRRLTYWLRFIPKVEDLWFALGPKALNDDREDFREFRELARDRILALGNTDSDEDNALIMRIDDYVFVELGVDGTACWVFKNNDLQIDMERKWVYIGAKPGSGLPYRLKRSHGDGGVAMDRHPAPDHAAKPHAGSSKRLGNKTVR